ncbi:hypothetical protein EHM76_04370 [bacterium]|nr:MAG: hypothetical protein EHM76_04370 [bacterium]
MNGFVMAMGRCIRCGVPFSFNPHFVPSIRVEGVRQPVCRSCVEWANEERKKAGIEPHFIHPEAYEPLPEEQL